FHMDLNHARLPIPPHPHIQFALSNTSVIIHTKALFVNTFFKTFFKKADIFLPSPDRRFDLSGEASILHCYAFHTALSRDVSLGLEP
ncbi:MAG: hypothetical protein J6V15_07750, partial [Clostridia bacterium]|nr:hypothetical protein [Clostridia bacterium]